MMENYSLRQFIIVNWDEAKLMEYFLRKTNKTNIQSSEFWQEIFPTKYVVIKFWIYNSQAIEIRADQSD